MSVAVLDDYFSFMSGKSDKSGSKPVPPDQRVVFQPAQANGRPDASKHSSQIEVSETPLSDSEIERIFRRP